MPDTVRRGKRVFLKTFSFEKDPLRGLYYLMVRHLP
jgi:hypothetical protein